MRDYPEIAVEKAMKREEIMLRAYAKKISWIEAAEIMRWSGRQVRRVGEKYVEVSGVSPGRARLPLIIAASRNRRRAT